MRNNIEDEKKHHPGGRLYGQEHPGQKDSGKNKRVKIFGESFALKAEVEVINAFSAHADKNDLVEYVQRAQGRLKKVFIVHGDMDQSRPWLLI